MVELFEKALKQAAQTLGMSLSEAEVVCMGQHWRMVQSWNQRSNLTAITNDTDAAIAHYADSIVAATELTGLHILDIGSGGGYPGIPLAIVRPDLQFTLLELRRRKCSFLRKAVADLGLKNVRVVEGDVAKSPSRLFDTAVTRAVFSEGVDLAQCLAWVEDGGRLIAYRADNSTECLPLSPKMHGYTLGERKRALAIWIKVVEKPT